MTTITLTTTRRLRRTGFCRYLKLFMVMPVPLLIAASALGEQASEGFPIPMPGKVFEFPRDHGSHPEFKIEWWYVTGHLFAEDGRRFGFQATFFRQAGPQQETGPPLFQHRQLYLAHMAFLDTRTGRFLHEERLNRGGWNADASPTTLDLFNGNWSLRLTDPAKNRMTLRGTVEGTATLDLQLEPAKPLVIFGKDGVSRKASLAAAASHYLTFTRLKTSGVLQLDPGTKVAVTGEAWMDHEISSSQLSPEQSGWDWAAIQLKDGREIMVYRLRLKQGGMDDHSTLAWIDAHGRVEHLPSAGFSWEVLGHWDSPVTKARYPNRVAIHTTDPATQKKVSFILEPLADAQEQTGALGGTAYWEGACRVLDDKGEETGSAFLELAGYAGDLSERFR